MANPSYPKYSSVKTLVNGLFDYAGLFPPASLSLSDAVKEYHQHRADSDSWMLGPFVVTVGHLSKLAQTKSQFSKESPVSFVILPRNADGIEDFCDTLASDLEECAAFLDLMEGRANISAFEFAFPGDALTSAGEIIKGLASISSTLDASKFAPTPAFVEIKRTATFKHTLPLFFLGLASTERQAGLFAKIRCGGMKSSDFPSPNELAHFIRAAVRIDHPFKATAGLHHPLRHFNEYQQILMHGFVNVFFATTLARVHDLDEAQIEEILVDENDLHFVFSDSGIEWTNLKASTTDFIRDRRSLALSIGSCSFTEPREDLTKLGWLTHQ